MRPKTLHSTTLYKTEALVVWDKYIRGFLKLKCDHHLLVSPDTWCVLQVFLQLVWQLIVFKPFPLTASLHFLLNLSLLSRLTLWCMKSSCCGWAGPKGRWTPSGSRWSPSHPKEAYWPFVRAGRRRPVTQEQSLLQCGGQQTKAGKTTTVIQNNKHIKST